MESDYDPLTEDAADIEKALFAEVMARLQAGRWAEAELACRQWVDAAPKSPEATHLWGVTLHQLGRLTEAETAFRTSLELRPDFPDAHLNLGSCLLALGRPEDAEASYRAAVSLRPDSPNAHYNLGNVLARLRRPEAAATSYRAALALDPDMPEAHSGLGAALAGSGDLAGCITAYRRAIAIRPGWAEACYLLAGALHELGELVEAAETYRAALRIEPEFAAAHNELGNVLRDLGRPAEATARYREALRLHPDFADAHNNLGAALTDLGNLPAAIASFQEALRRRPDFADAHFNRGCALLLAGPVAAGWAEYEWRWQTPQLAKEVRSLRVPRWNGEALSRRTVLLHAEQGLGDTLQFCRFVPLAAARIRVILEVQKPLVRLLSALPGVDEVIPRGATLPDCEAHCPLMSLPHVLGAAALPLAARIPYLQPDPDSVVKWRRRLADLRGLRVGLVWAAGGKEDRQQRVDVDRRSIPLAMLEPLARASQASSGRPVSFVSLQKEPPAAALSGGLSVDILDIGDELADFADTAAVVRNLDLVITVDTAVAHLCGSMGAPAWVLNRFESNWRWPRHRDDTPWYPTLRQFRQRTIGDWAGVIDELATAFERLVSGDLTQLRPRGAWLSPGYSPYPNPSRARA